VNIAVKGFERLVATGADDRIHATGDFKQIDGAGGNDEINANTSTAVVLAGGDGNDTIWGSSSNDILMGGAGDEMLLFGGDGDDLIFGNSGSDTLSGGAGADVFVVSPGQSITILDPEAADRLLVGLTPDIASLDQLLEVEALLGAAVRRIGGGIEEPQWYGAYMFDSVHYTLDAQGNVTGTTSLLGEPNDLHAMIFPGPDNQIDIFFWVGGGTAMNGPMPPDATQITVLNYVPGGLGLSLLPRDSQNYYESWNTSVDALLASYASTTITDVWHT
jgi:hypothetical protein